MPRSQRDIARIGAGVAVFALLGLLGAAPSSAAERDTLYTASQSRVGPWTLGTISSDTLAFSAIGPSLPATIELGGIDVFGSTGYAVGYDSAVATWVVFTWDRTTGAIGTPVPLTEEISDLDIGSVSAADTLADGTLIAFLSLDGPADDPQYVVSVDPVTGAMTALVDISGAATYFQSLATDPTTSKTYAFVRDDDGIPLFFELALEIGKRTRPIELTGIRSSLGDGYLLGADFDSAGVLWFYYSTNVLAFTSGPFGVAATAQAAGPAPHVVDVQTSLTVAAPLVVPAALAATGIPVAGIAVSASVLIAAALGAFLIRRELRSRAPRVAS